MGFEPSLDVLAKNLLSEVLHYAWGGIRVWQGTGNVLDWQPVLHPCLDLPFDTILGLLPYPLVDRDLSGEISAVDSPRRLLRLHEEMVGLLSAMGIVVVSSKQLFGQSTDRLVSAWQELLGAWHLENSAPVFLAAVAEQATLVE
jgi:hypothetical protein